MSTHNIPKIIAGLLLVTALSATADEPPQVSLLREFRPIGGVRNNLQNWRLNAVPGAPEIALAPLNYIPDNATGNVILPGPNPRTISNQISGATGPNGEDLSLTEDPVASAWLYVFGQFLDHDIGLEATPLTNTKIDISIPSPDPNDGTVIPMNRATRDPDTNTIINTTAGYLDLSQLYGSDRTTAASLRFPDGTLKTSYSGTALPLDPTETYFISGDPRVMENPELTATTALFMREHNFWVRTLKAQHPEWSGDQLYHMAKAITTGEYQNIIYKEFLPLLVGDQALGPYRGYNPTINAQSSQEFSTAAFRVGHSQISGEQTGIDNRGNEVFTQSLDKAFANTAAMDITHGIDPLLRNDMNQGFDPLLRNLGTDPSQATDVYAVNELRNLLVANLVGGGVDTIDLIAIDIQRVRDVGLASLNQTRIALHLQPYATFAQLTSDPILQGKLDAVYNHQINSVDLFIGGLAEKHASGALVGPTFQAIIVKQFDALRAGDRFFWANEGFDQATATLIANTSLADLLERNTDTPKLQDNVFVAAPLPPLVRRSGHHLPWPGIIDGHGRQRPFIHD